jgi:hypothetical protein
VTHAPLSTADISQGAPSPPKDIAHYQRIVVALKETIRLMGEIDEVIEAHGGWLIE